MMAGREIASRFPIRGEGRTKTTEQIAQNLALVIEATVPDPRCRALALTKLEECMLWAAKGRE
jgi:hypothetical protein